MYSITPYNDPFRKAHRRLQRLLDRRPTERNIERAKRLWLHMNEQQEGDEQDSVLTITPPVLSAWSGIASWRWTAFAL